LLKQSPNFIEKYSFLAHYKLEQFLFHFKIKTSTLQTKIQFKFGVKSQKTQAN